MDAFKNDGRIQRIVWCVKFWARGIGKKKWEEMEKADNEWMARAAKYRAGLISAEELGDRPPGIEELVYNDRLLYNFRRLRYVSDLIVLGKGYLYVSATITVQRGMRHDGLITIWYGFQIKDWFRDAYDATNTIDDIVAPGYEEYLEYDNGTPYRIEGGWILAENGTYDPRTMSYGTWFWTALN